MKGKHSDIEYICEECEKFYSRKAEFMKHLNKFHCGRKEGKETGYEIEEGLGAKT